jgi:taurine--2-oxoglutarate transaminase
MNELVAACKKNGLMPFNNFNRIHLCPPCNISVEDAQLGLEILDQSLTEIAMYYTGA